MPDPIRFRTRTVLLAAGFALAATGCATVETVPYCEEGEVAVVQARCADDPEAEAALDRLAEVINPEAGPLRVRMELGEAGDVKRMCVDRSKSRRAFHHRKSVAAQRAAIDALPPAPACLADGQLVFNEFAAVLDDIDEVKDRCQREASTGSGYGLDGFDSGVYTRCLADRQAERGEIWMEDLGEVYVRDDGTAGDRSKALRECGIAIHTQYDSAGGSRIARLIIKPEEFNPCMAQYGWFPLSERVR